MARAAYLAPGVYVEEIPSSRQPIAGVGTNTVGFIGLVPDEIWQPVRNPNYDPVMAQSLHAYRLSRAAVITSGSDDERSRAQASADADAAPLRARQATLQTRVDALVTEARTLAEAAETAKKGVDAAAAKLVGLEGEAADEAASELNAAQSDALVKQQASDLKQEELKNEQFELENLKGILSADTAATTTAGTRGGAVPTTATTTTTTTTTGGGGGAGGGGTGDGGAAGGGDRRSQPGKEDLTYRHSDPDPQLTHPSMFRPYYLQKFTIRAAEFDTKLCTNYSEYVARFGDFSAFKDDAPHESDPAKKTFQPLSPGHHLLTHAVNGFFGNGGTICFVARVHPDNIGNWQKVLDQFESIEDVAIIAAPGVPKSKPNWDVLQSYCESDAHQNVFAILDSPLYVEDEQGVLDTQKLQPDNPRALMPRRSTHAAFYFPWIQVMDPAKRLQDSDPAWGVDPQYRGLTYVAPSGFMAGIYARTDAERGPHKAPANTIVRGAVEVKYYVSRPKQEGLNPQGVNCIRLMNGDVTVWGARCVGGDSLSEWKYISVRRFAGFLEESITRGTQWIVFEPNDQSLWSKIILNISAFLTNVWRSGALFGVTPQQAFYVKCDEELNPPEVRDLGQVITEIGVAIVRPAEFVIFRITQSTGQQQG